MTIKTVTFFARLYIPACTLLLSDVICVTQACWQTPKQTVPLSLLRFTRIRGISLRTVGTHTAPSRRRPPIVRSTNNRRESRQCVLLTRSQRGVARPEIRYRMKITNEKFIPNGENFKRQHELKPAHVEMFTLGSSPGCFCLLLSSSTWATLVGDRRSSGGRWPRFLGRPPSFSTGSPFCLFPSQFSIPPVEQTRVENPLLYFTPSIQPHESKRETSLFSRSFFRVYYLVLFSLFRNMCTISELGGGSPSGETCLNS